jgi:hypothetical protein
MWLHDLLWQKNEGGNDVSFLRRKGKASIWFSTSLSYCHCEFSNTRPSAWVCMSAVIKALLQTCAEIKSWDQIVRSNREIKSWDQIMRSNREILVSFVTKALANLLWMLDLVPHIPGFTEVHCGYQWTQSEISEWAGITFLFCKHYMKNILLST